MEGISMNTLQMDPYWNQYWQQSMLINSMYQGGAQQTGMTGVNPSFQANPASGASTNVQTMPQEETPKKGKGGLIAGGLVTIGLAASTIIAARKGKKVNGNIIDGYKQVWKGLRGKVDDVFAKTKELNGKKIQKVDGKINRLKTEADVAALGGKTGAFDIKDVGSSIRRYTCVVDDVTCNVHNGRVVSAIGKDGKKVEVTGDLEKHIDEFITSIKDKNVDNIAKLQNIEYVHTENGIRRIFRADSGTATPEFQYGVSKWFPEPDSSIPDLKT